MTVRSSAIRQRALAGDSVLGAMVFEFFVPGMPQILKAADCEFALFDMEHAGLGFETLKMLVAACRGAGIEPLVRVPRSEYHFLARALDVGVHGVMVPMVESAAEARRIAGAGLDEFEQEPADSANPLLRMGNVIVAPHALAWTDESFHAIASDGLQSVLDFPLGRRLAHLVISGAWPERQPGRAARQQARVFRR